MNNQAITLDTRFSEIELFRMFNVECETVEGKPVDSCKVNKPLWKVRKVKASKRAKANVTNGDFIRDGITCHAAGSKERVADMIRFYAAEMEKEEKTSAFLV